MPGVSVPEKRVKSPYKMIDKELIDKIRQIKVERGYTLYDLSKRIDIQVGTLERWLKTGHINKLYAAVVREKLGIK